MHVCFGAIGYNLIQALRGVGARNIDEAMSGVQMPSTQMADPIPSPLSEGHRTRLTLAVGPWALSLVSLGPFPACKIEVRFI